MPETGKLRAAVTKPTNKSDKNFDTKSIFRLQKKTGPLRIRTTDLCLYGQVRFRHKRELTSDFRFHMNQR